ncbi:MAG: NADH:flavin oxidoreductase [Planctomycetota bacterium]|nr:MAG: NADH:flavin oxidoreductase [Planctomycetota bacterium]
MTPPLRIPTLKSVDDFRQALASFGLELPVDDLPLSAAEGTPLAEPLTVGKLRIGNRWCIHPMEGWDGTPGGQPSEHTLRRWRNFGLSGAKLLWGGEAFAVRPDGRANPRQLCYRPENVDSLHELIDTARDAHTQEFGAGSTDDLLIGLQLTHSGRFCKPNRADRFEPRVAYHHPVLDARVGIKADDDSCVWTDGQIRELIAAYVVSATAAQAAGFGFVDLKCCHGYLGHEFLSAFDRPGDYGGDFAGRTRFIRELVSAVRSECPGLEIGIRLSLWDTFAYRPDPALSTPGKLGPGIAVTSDSRLYPVFGANRQNPLEIDLREPIALIDQLWREHGVQLWNLTAGSPYYNPHVQRPAIYPPSDGYSPPEDPLIGCVRQIQAVRDVRRTFSGEKTPLFVGTAYTYFQEYLPHVAQAVVREGWVDSVGLGRLVLSDWQLPAKVLEGKNYAADKKICRTFSDCTTAPRNGIISGCYPLDPYYKEMTEAAELKHIKAQGKR